ncbi:MAG: YccF domain-containing protein [Anaerolineae bacterium]
MAMTTSVRQEAGVPFLIRVLWFFLIGWHVTLYWIAVAWLLNLTVIGLPLGVWMLNRVPLVLTLRTQASYHVVEVRDGRLVEWRENVPQYGWLLRLIYFLLIGWWFSLLWALLGWLLCVTIIGLPFGVWMLNRLPAVTTLMKH